MATSRGRRMDRWDLFVQRHGSLVLATVLAVGYLTMRLSGSEGPGMAWWNPFGWMVHLLMAVEGLLILLMTAITVGSVVWIPIGVGLSIRDVWRGRRRRHHAPEAPEAFWSDEAVVAWRSWTHLGGNLMGMRMPWSAGVFEATCARNCEQVPGWDCTCGVYAVKDPADVVRFGWGAEVIGKVELTGMVIEHENGYRAERARIVELRVRDRDTFERLRVRYPKAEVILVDTVEEAMTP